MGIQILVNDPQNLEKIRDRECGILRERCEKILKSGANLILTTQGIDDVAAKYLVDAGAIGIRRIPKGDLRKIAKCTGATLITSLANAEGEESFEASFLGTAGEVHEETIGDQDFAIIKGFKHASCCSIVLRGANEFMIDEVER